MARQQRVKAETFLDEANRKLKKNTWFSSSTEQKYEDAAELFDKAANAYKVGGLYGEAGGAYQKAAELYRDKLKNAGEASKCLSSAGESRSPRRVSHVPRVLLQKNLPRGRHRGLPLRRDPPVRRRAAHTSGEAVEGNRHATGE